MVLDNIYLNSDLTNELVAVTEAYNSKQKDDYHRMTFQDMAEMILKDGINHKYNMLKSWQRGDR